MNAGFFFGIKVYISELILTKILFSVVTHDRTQPVTISLYNFSPRAHRMEIKIFVKFSSLNSMVYLLYMSPSFGK